MPIGENAADEKTLMEFTAELFFCGLFNKSDPLSSVLHAAAPIGLAQALGIDLESNSDNDFSIFLRNSKMENKHE